MSRLFTALLLVVLLSADANAAQAAPKRAGCGAVELMEGYDTYNQTVCSAVRDMERGRYSQAIEELLRAKSMGFVEYPNFLLYPRLALAYFKSGDKVKAKETLKKAELTLLIYQGVVHCEEGDQEFHLVAPEDVKIEPSVSEEVIGVMCGAIYEEYYHPHTLVGVIEDAKLIKHYCDVQKRIEGHSICSSSK